MVDSKIEVGSHLEIESDIDFIYGRMARLIAQESPSDWQRVDINMEMLVEGEQIQQSYACRCYRGEQMWEVDYPPSYELVDLFLALNDAYCDRNRRWTICNFRLFRSGDYKVQVSYDSPPRLTGKYLAGTQRGEPLF